MILVLNFIEIRFAKVMPNFLIQEFHSEFF